MGDGKVATVQEALNPSRAPPRPVFIIRIEAGGRRPQNAVPRSLAPPFAVEHFIIDGDAAIKSRS